MANMQRWRMAGHNVGAMRALAQRALPRPVFDFADGGAEDEHTLRRNESAFDAIEFMPRPLNGAAERDLSVEIFGRRLALPVMIGPTGLAGLFWPGGELAAARAAAAAGTAYCISHASVCPLEAVPDLGAPRWMQVFIFKDRGFTRELAARAQASRHDALVLTIDNQILGNRERDLRNGFKIPPRFKTADLAAMALKLPWLLRMRGEIPKITFGNYVRPGQSEDIAALAGRMASLLDPSMSFADVAMLREAWAGPLILKGVLDPDEAAQAVALGVDGLIVSNHGGRQLDGAPAAIDALPAIVERIGGAVPVMVDGGIRRGADVVRALALGADLCLIGRPQLWGLAVGGEAGVAHVLDIFRREIDRVMGLVGVRNIAEIGPHCLFRRHERAVAAPVATAAPPRKIARL